MTSPARRGRERTKWRRAFVIWLVITRTLCHRNANVPCEVQASSGQGAASSLLLFLWCLSWSKASEEIGICSGELWYELWVDCSKALQQLGRENWGIA
ncbi:hypothetical protein AV530_000564 [Patagioenas fasciata monilis]|uniref:Secreted protein n=1 Tax=Patagioenas fasciata monilis TaxID=372326 RepID=A0A1V4IFV1_PATFA|nr:hypothetical protein AV530_000564 [Patagioenas fasciata monilis]